jgi:hypothetical protein
MTCEACGREFKPGRELGCPWCGYNNGPGELPRLEMYRWTIEEPWEVELEEYIDLLDASDQQ